MPDREFDEEFEEEVINQIAFMLKCGYSKEAIMLALTSLAGESYAQSGSN